MARETKEAKAQRLAAEEQAQHERTAAFRRALPLRLLKLAAKADNVGVTVNLLDNNENVGVEFVFPPTEAAQHRAREYDERAYRQEHKLSLASDEWEVERVEEELQELLASRAEEERLRNRKAELLSMMSADDKKALGLNE